MAAPTLDLKRVPKMVGEDMKETFQEIYSLLRRTSVIPFLVGPSGSGKTLTAMNLAKAYAKKHEVPAYYVQLSPDMTKTSLILGLRLVNGSLVPVKGLLSEAMEAGGVVVVDEVTHSTQELILMLNSICERTSVTSVGDQIVYAADTFRVIFCSNRSNYAGNVRLPQSFANRVTAFNFDYPSAKTEQEVARAIADGLIEGEEFTVPDSVAAYLTSFIREFRTDSFPLSARNVANMLVRLNFAKRTSMPDISSIITGPNAEATRGTVVRRITGRAAANASEMMRSDVKSFLDFVALVTPKRFREIVLGCCMYYLDVEGVEFASAEFKAKLAAAVI